MDFPSSSFATFLTDSGIGIIAPVKPGWGLKNVFTASRFLFIPSPPRKSTIVDIT